MTLIQCENGNIAITKVNPEMIKFISSYKKLLFTSPGGQSPTLPTRQTISEPRNVVPEGQSVDQILGGSSH